jgi:hypothetical protein
LPSFCTGCGSKAPNSSGHQRRLLINLHSRTAEFPPTSGNQRPLPGRWRWCDRPWLCDAQESKRASHIDPPTSSYAIMRRAGPYRGENPGPGEDVEGELEPRPGIREQPGSGPTKLTVSITSPLYPRKRTLEWVKQDQDDPPVCRRRCSQYRRTLSSSWNRRPEPRSITPSFVRS